MATQPPSYDQSFQHQDPDKIQQNSKSTNETPYVRVEVEPEPISDDCPLPEIVDNEGFTDAQQSFQYKEVRRNFVKKVYITLGLQLFTTAVVVFLISYFNQKTGFVFQNIWSYYLAYGIFFTTYITIACIPNVRRKHPHNIICLLVFTLALSYMAGMIASFHTTRAILIAFGASFLVCGSITLFAIQTKFDMTTKGMLLMVVLMSFLAFTIITIFTYRYNWYLDVVWGSLGTLVFGMFLVYRTQLVMGGHRYALSPEEHIYGALMIYVDMVQIFLFILGMNRK